MLCDVVARAANERKSVLIVGDRRSGKTTALREIAAELARSRRTVIIDTLGEVGGDGATKHESLGDALLMRVLTIAAHQEQVDQQASNMLEAMFNLRAEVIHLFFCFS